MAATERTAIVTGAAGGMGRAISRRLVEDGFRVLMADINADAAEKAAAEIGPAAAGVGADIGNEADREALIGAAKDLFVLVNNAGLFGTASVADLRAEDFRRMYEINTVALFELSRMAAARMKGRGGRIVNIASRAALGGPMIAHYAASKGAVVSLTRCLALELAPDQILVNAIGPGIIDTPMLGSWSEAERARMASYQPLNKIGRPEDVANVVSLLASPRTDYLTGQIIYVDGGRSLGGGNV